MLPVAAWEALDEPWRGCIELASEAYAAGTIPVGAALVDGDGNRVAEGRNRVYEPIAPAPQIAHSLLAHAEVNALVGLDPERRYLRRNPDGAVVAAYERHLPDVLAVARALVAAGAQESAAAGVALPEALPGIWPILAGH